MRSYVSLIIKGCVLTRKIPFLALPYIIYYIVLWNPSEFNYNALYIITSSLPLTIQFKINLIITLSIALDRFQVGFLKRQPGIEPGPGPGISQGPG